MIPDNAAIVIMTKSKNHIPTNAEPGIHNNATMQGFQQWTVKPIDMLEKEKKKKKRKHFPITLPERKPYS